MKSVQQQSEHHNQKALNESFHLSGHTFRFRLTVQDLWSVLGLIKLAFGGKGLLSFRQTVQDWKFSVIAWPRPVGQRTLLVFTWPS